MKEWKNGRPWAAAARAALVMVLASACVLAGSAQAAEAVPDSGPAEGGRMVVPLGRTVGIKLFSDGVMVVGLSEVDTGAGRSAPARDCGLQAGDIITHINSEEVDTIEDVQQVLAQVGGEKMSIRASREGRPLQLTAQAVQCSADGAYKLGAWIRDSMAGIGTMTFYDPESGRFGALGHGINDVDTAQLMPLESGSIMYSEVAHVKKGVSGEPGELQGAFEVERDLGELYANTAQGIFGQLTDPAMAEGLEPMEVAQRSQVKTGPAVIRSNIDGQAVEEYGVEIVHLYPAGGDGRDLMLQVTDPRLLEATGGIVQGMSGSPILQDGRIVGAVTHVLVNDPTRGYGLLLEHMLETAQAAAD